MKWQKRNIIPPDLPTPTNLKFHGGQSWPPMRSWIDYA